MHRPQTADWQPCHSGQYLWTSRPSSTQAQAADRLIDSLAACEGPHLKALILNNSYLAPVTEPSRAYWLYSRKAKRQAEGSCRARGDCIPQKDLTH